MENVSGMVKGKMRLIFAEILQELKGAGYHVSATADERHVLRRPPVAAADDLRRSPGGHMEQHPGAMTALIACGDSLAGCDTPSEQLEKLREASKKYRAYRHWSRIRLGSSEKPITGEGFNAVKFDPRKPAGTIRRNDGNLGMHGAMRWDECRPFSLPEFKRFGSFPDGFAFARAFEEGIRQVGNSIPPLFMRAIARHIRLVVLPAARGEEEAA